MARGGKRTGAGRKFTGRQRLVIYTTEEETLAVKQLIENLRLDVEESKTPVMTSTLESKTPLSIAEKSALLLELTKELSEKCHSRIVALKADGKTNNIIAEILTTEGFLSATNEPWNVAKLKKYTRSHLDVAMTATLEM
ncbi:hypothetical protein [Pelosinus sp. sgz500959]|uniref:hypothetical protein n=1 Tax=Pelosinus sp. sgz500959 TaxID=3242472 RepID=UPI00366D091E